MPRTKSQAARRISPDWDQLPPVLSVPEAAAVVGIDRNTYYEGVKRGQWPARKTGLRNLCVPKELLRRALEGTE